MPDKIHLTVAAVVCSDGKFLLVRERDGDTIVINQPAGHVEPGESPLDAVKRETLEETGWLVEPQALLGFSVFKSPENGITYYRFGILCDALERQSTALLDTDIIDVLWLAKDEIALSGNRVRSPMVIQAIEDYWAGIRYPLEFIRDYR